MRSRSTEALLKLVPFLVLWVSMIVLKLVTTIAGLVVVATMYRLRNTHINVMRHRWKILLPWVNPEDWYGGPKGVDGVSLPQWWIDREGISFKSWWWYHAIRNPANGLRNFEMLDLDIDMKRVRYVTGHYCRMYEPSSIRNRVVKAGRNTIWYLAWQGWKASFKIVHIWNAERHLQIRIGWKVEPRDSKSPVMDPVRSEDAGFSFKVLPYRRG